MLWAYTWHRVNKEVTLSLDPQLFALEPGLSADAVLLIPAVAFPLFLCFCSCMFGMAN